LPTAQILRFFRRQIRYDQTINSRINAGVDELCFPNAKWIIRGHKSDWNGCFKTDTLDRFQDLQDGRAFCKALKKEACIVGPSARDPKKDPNFNDINPAFQKLRLTLGLFLDRDHRP